LLGLQVDFSRNQTGFQPQWNMKKQQFCIAMLNVTKKQLQHIKKREKHTRKVLYQQVLPSITLFQNIHTLSPSLAYFNFISLCEKYLIFFRSYETAALLAREARTQNPALLQEAVDLSLKFSFFSLLKVFFYSK
jgi:hypothetical protein